MSAPDAEKGWASTNDTPLPTETQHEEPVADKPLERVGTEKELEVHTDIGVMMNSLRSISAATLHKQFARKWFPRICSRPDTIPNIKLARLILREDRDSTAIR